MTVNPEAAIQSEALRQAVGASGQEPTTASEIYLAALWSEIIGAPRVRLADRFLDVGGNSLTLNILLTRIKAETGVELDSQRFFDDEHSSLRELAGELDAAKQRPPEQS
jgi:hypothetical protein